METSVSLYHFGKTVRSDWCAFQPQGPQCLLELNKYAIHAYTHGPVTGSGPSVSMVPFVATHPLVELRVLLVPPPPPRPSLLPYSANVKLTARLSAFAVRKRHTNKACKKRILNVFSTAQIFVDQNYQITYYSQGSSWWTPKHCARLWYSYVILHNTAMC